MSNAIHELLPTTVIGAWAWPGWFHRCMAAARRGEYGLVDTRELQDDAVDVAIRDQTDAGIDIITDGEIRRGGSFGASFYRRIPGLEAVAPGEEGTASARDRHRPPHRLRGVDGLTCPDGLGAVAEFEYARIRTGAGLMVPLPGPYTLAGGILTGGDEPFASRAEVAEALVPILRREIQDLIAAGARYIQLDEPSPSLLNTAAVDVPALFNRLIAGLDRRGGAEIWLHLCLGRGGDGRAATPVVDQIQRFGADQVHLEFADGAMSQIAIAGALAQRFARVNVGVIDVTAAYRETPADVADRIRVALEYVPAEKLILAPCRGFADADRDAARHKAAAMVRGAAIVRAELTGI